MASLWPSQLQSKMNVDNFSVQFGNTLVRSDVDVGLAKVRSRYTSAIDLYTVSIDLDIDDFDILYNFFKTTLNNGATTFLFDNPMNNDATEEFRFFEPPVITPIGARYFKVQMKWERLPT